MRIPVTIACSLAGKHVWLKVEVEEGTTVEELAKRTDLSRSLPGFSLEGRSFGIYGKLVTPETELQAGDRLEIYQPVAGSE